MVAGHFIGGIIKVIFHQGFADRKGRGRACGVDGICQKGRIGIHKIVLPVAISIGNHRIGAKQHLGTVGHAVAIAIGGGLRQTRACQRQAKQGCKRKGREGMVK